MGIPYSRRRSQSPLRTDNSSPSYYTSPPLQPLKDEPWRETGVKWTEADVNRLMEDVKKISPRGDKKRVGVCLLGQVGAGKSSFVNSIMSIAKGRIVNRAQAANAEKSYTTGLGRFRDRTFANFTLCDTMGLENVAEKGFNVKDLMYLITGHVPTNYTFNPQTPINDKTPGFIKEPKETHKMFCVVYVVSASALLADLPGEILNKIKELQDKVKEAGIARILIITKVDLVCPEVKKDISTIFRSNKVEEVVHIASEAFQLPLQNIHPLKNYSDEIVLKPLNHIPLLLALKQILEFTEDYFDNLAANSEDED